MHIHRNRHSSALNRKATSNSNVQERIVSLQDIHVLTKPQRKKRMDKEGKEDGGTCFQVIEEIAYC
jgi:hypothetical protein